MGIIQQEKIGIADALFTSVQQRVLGILFGQPDRSFLSKEVIALAKSGTGAVHRELRRLAASGLVTMTSAGWEKHYQANAASPVFEELRGLVVKTVGLAGPISAALQPLADRIRVAFVFGSQAQGTATAASDIDLMIIGEDISYAEAFAALAEAERGLSRTINPTILTMEEWRQRREAHDPFVQAVSGRPKSFLSGTQDDLL